MFADDGTTATLDTPDMVSALTFLQGPQVDRPGVMPAEADYNVADGMFKNGAPGAAPASTARASRRPRPPPRPAWRRSIINGDWTLGAYADLFGDKLNVCPIPKSPGPIGPSRTSAGTYLMLSKALADDAAKQAAVLDFAKYVTDKANSSTWSRR